MKDFLKKIAFQYTRWGAPRYQYCVEPIQLAEIILAIEQARKLRSPINVFEIGVARGMTSRFICEHISSQKINAQFYCIDTFASFLPKDIDYEVAKRGKTRAELNAFSDNDYDTWREHFAKFGFLTAVKTDAAEFDFSKVEGGVDVMFLDVDLYKPTLAVLENAAPYFNEGATILVDDVQDNCRWDGAYQAFMEFVTSLRIPPPPPPALLGTNAGRLCGAPDQIKNPP